MLIGSTVFEKNRLMVSKNQNNRRLYTIGYIKTAVKKYSALSSSLIVCYHRIYYASCAGIKQNSYQSS